MILRVLPIDFDRILGYVTPKDAALHKMAIQFAENELLSIPNFSEYTKVWACCKMNENDEPLEIDGLLGFAMRPDVTLCRFKTPQSMIKLYNRANSFFCDNGARGSEVFVLVSPEEKAALRCPEVEKTLDALKALPANRFSIKVV